LFLFGFILILYGVAAMSLTQWRNRLTEGPWTNYIKGPIPHFEVTEQFIKVLTKITIKHKTMMKCEVDVHKKSAVE